MQQRRIISHCLLGVLALAFIFSIMALPRSIGAARDGSAEEIFVYREVVVQRGDSLWSIAVENAPPTLSTPDAVTLIREVNDLSSCVIRPDQRLWVPAGRRDE